MNTEAKLEFYTLLLDWLQSGKMNGDRCSAIFEACREGWHTPEFDPKQSAFLNQYMRDKIAQGHTFRTPKNALELCLTEKIENLKNDL